MSTKKKILIILAGIIVVALAIVGIIALNGNNDDTVTPGQNKTQTSDPKATGTPSAQPTINAEEMKKIDEEADKASSFDDVHAVANFSKEDVQDSLKTSIEFAKVSLGTGYYLSGKWVEDGMPNNLDDAVGRYFSPDIRETIKKMETNPSKNNQVSKDVMPLMFFLYPADRVAGHPACLENSDGEMGDQEKATINCPMGNIEISNMSYDPTVIDAKNGILVTFSATAKIPVLLDGKDAYTEVTDEFTLNFVPNEKYDEQTSPNKFVINQYRVATTSGAATLVKE